MKRRAIVWAAVLAAAAVAGTLMLGRPGAPVSSTLSASARGWLAARTYLERRGSSVSVVDRPLDQVLAADGGTLILGLPWQVLPTREDLDAVRRRLAGGGTVVYAYSGQPASAGEDELAAALGLGFDSVRGKAPLTPLAWRRFAAAEWRLDPDAGFADAGGGARVVIHAPDRIPRAPKGAGGQVLFRGEKGVPAVFAYPRARGRVIVLPADALSNARLGNAGNADLLESLRVAAGTDVAFDEYHHGVMASEFAAAPGAAPSLDLLLAQVLTLYLLVAWSLARRFGPAWDEPPEIASSTTSFLLGLGTLHRKLRHSAAASLRLIDDAESLDPRVRVPASLRHTAVDAGEPAFLDIARTVARLQRRGRPD